MSTLPTISADELRAIRAEMDLTQAQFAKLMGVSRLTVWRWENDPIKRENGTTAQLARLFQTLFRVGVPVAGLLAGGETLAHHIRHA